MDIAAKIKVYETEHGEPPENEDLVAFIDPLLGQSSGMTVLQAMDIIDSAIGLGCEEYGG